MKPNERRRVVKERNSKEHEVNVLNSVFSDSKRFFDDLGYSDYSFESRIGNGVPDGLFSNGSSTIWVEHTQAMLNYGKKGSILPGFGGFCNDVQRELLKDNKNGCLCFDIPSSLTDIYFSSLDFKSEILDITKEVIYTSNEYVDKERNIYVKYCSPDACCFNNLNEFKGLRVTVSQWLNIGFCKIIPRTIYDKCLSNKEDLYRANLSSRNENWLFIEEPWGYSFMNDLPEDSFYFDKVFIVNCEHKNGKECFVPKLSATKKINSAPQ